MSKRKHTSQTRRIESVREARAGLIPASDDMADERRAQLNCAVRIIAAVKPCLGSLRLVSDRHAITNILADLRHYCDSKELAFSKLDAAAHTLYLQEKADTVT